MDVWKRATTKHFLLVKLYFDGTYRLLATSLFLFGSICNGKIVYVCERETERKEEKHREKENERNFQELSPQQSQGKRGLGSRARNIVHCVLSSL